MAYFQAKLNSALIPHAQGRDERLELPESALREAVVNAIAHRDYRSTTNFTVNLIAGLIAYTWQAKKPSLHLSDKDMALLPTLI